MKKRILNLGFACVGILMLTSCEKQAQKTLPAAQPKEESNQTTSTQEKPKPDPSINGCYGSLDKGKGCWPLVACNCTILKDIVIKPHFSEMLRQASGTNDGGNVASIFKDPEFVNEISKFPQQVLDSLRSGHYYLKVVTDDAQTMCVITGPHYPVTDDNMFSAFQYNK